MLSRAAGEGSGALHPRLTPGFEITNFGVFQRISTPGGAARLGEEWDIVKPSSFSWGCRCRQRQSLSPARKKAQTVSQSRGTEGPLAPRREPATILASPARGTAASCPPRKGCLPLPDHRSPEPLPLGRWVRGSCHPAPPPSIFTPYLRQTKIHHIFWPEYIHIYIFF